MKEGYVYGDMELRTLQLLLRDLSPPCYVIPSALIALLHLSFSTFCLLEGPLSKR